MKVYIVLWLPEDSDEVEVCRVYSNCDAAIEYRMSRENPEDYYIIWKELEDKYAK